MELVPTNLVLVQAPLPADFDGTPQELAEAMTERYAIMSPAGTNFFTIGDVEPSSNVGPWLKGGTQWYVFSTSEGQYIPLDISASTASLFTGGTTLPAAPTSTEARVFLRSGTDYVVGWYFYNTTLGWQPSGNVSLSGPTSQRPAAPVDFVQYFDTDINAMLHWERGAWRTVSGSPGDIKFVTTELLSQALTKNPGWSYLGDILGYTAGRALSVATKDSAQTFPPDTGLTARESGEVYGEETHVLTSTEIEQHTHLVGTLQSIAAADDHKVNFYRVDDGQVADPNFLAPAPRPPQSVRVIGTSATTNNGEISTASNGAVLVTSKQLSLSSAASYTKAAIAHNNLPPTAALWALTKD